MIKTFKELKDEEYLVSLGRGIAHVCWDEKGELKLKRKFDLEHTCRAMDTVNLFGKRYVFVGDSLNAHIIGIDGEDTLDINFSKSNNPINFVGVIPSQSVVNPAISDLEQILLINHLSHGLIGMSVYDAINNGEISKNAEGGSENKRVLRLESDNVEKRIIVLNPNYCYKILGKELISAGIEEGKLNIGRIKFSYFTSDDIKEIPQIPEIPYCTIGVEHDILLEHMLVPEGKATWDNAETVKCIDAYYDEKGVLRVFAGTDEARIYSWNSEREEARVVYQGENSIVSISNLQVFYEKGISWLAFNTRIPERKRSRYGLVKVINLREVDNDEQRAIVNDDEANETIAPVIYDNLLPCGFMIKTKYLYAALGNRFSINNISHDRKEQRRESGLDYSSDKCRFIDFEGMKDVNICCFVKK